MKPAISTRIFDLPDDELGLLFKPVQLRVIDKVSRGAILSPNEKRYLRGRLGKKLRLVEKLFRSNRRQKDAFNHILDQLGEYYITGYEALKHNGFGWYFEPRRIEIMNTHLDGNLVIDGKPVIFRRLKTINREWWTADPKSSRRYATNARILIDARRYRQDHLVKTWVSMLKRYGKVFIPNPRNYKILLDSIKDFGKPEDFGE